MSTLVDERIVSMGFDNKDFEQNVRQSMGTLDRLKSKLNFSGVANSMNDSLSSVSTKGIVASLEKVKVGFTTLEIVAISVINNLTNRIVDMGIELVKSLSVDNIATGWVKYGQKVKSVGTLMAQTLRHEDGTVMSEAEKIENINKNLELLTFYADETSYSFSDMLNNITKFTGAGVSLNDATQAMMGSSNWAALSGQDAATAARAQLQLSQAMGVGAMTLIDWKSIQNANMATEEFKQHAIDAAVAAGTLQQSIDGTYQTLDGTAVSAANFRNTLSKRWFTSDILLDVLKTYGGAVEEIYEVVQNNEDITLSTDAILLMGDELDEFAIKAYKAAQESRTLADAMEAIKETVETVYSGMFEAVFGVYSEAKQVWTDLVAVMYNMVVRDLVIKKEILDAWNDLGGRMDLFDRTEGDNGAFWNLLEAIQTIKDTIKDAWNIVFPISELKEEAAMIADVGQKLKDFTARLKEASKGWILNADQIDTFKGILIGIFTTLKAFGKLVGAIWRGISPLVSLFKEIVISIMQLLSGAGYGLDEFVEQTSMFKYIGDMLFSVSTVIAGALRSIGYWFGSVFEVIASDPRIQNGMSAIIEFFKALPGYIMTFYDTVKNSTVGSTFGALGEGITKFYELISTAFNNIGDLKVDKLDVLGDDTVKKLNPLYEILKGIGSLFVGMVSVLRAVIPIIGQAFTYLGQLLQLIGDKISSVFTGESGIGIEKLLDIAFWASILFMINELGDLFFTLFTSFNEMFAGIAGSLEGLEFQLKSQAIRNLAISLLIIAGAMFLLAAIPEEDFHRAVIVVAAFGAAMIAITASVDKFTPTIKTLSISSMFAAAKMSIAAKAMVDFGKAMLLFVASVWILSTIPQDKMINGLVGLIGIAATMIVFAKLINKNSGGLFMAGYALVGMSIAMGMMAVSLKILGTMDEDTMTRGITAMAGLSAVMIAFAMTAKFVKKANRTAFGMIIFAGALAASIVPLMILSTLSWDQLKIGLAGITGIAAVMMIMAQASRFVSKAIITAIGITALSIGLSSFAVAMSILSTLKWDGMYKALGAIGVLVLLVGLVTATSGAALATMVGLGISLALLSVGLVAFGFAMKKLGQNDWDVMKKALGAMGILVVLMAVLTNAFGASGIVTLAALGVSLVILSGGLILFAMAMKLLGSMKWKTLGKAMLVLVGAITLLAVAANLLSPLIPALLALGASMLVLGAGMILIGAGLALIVGSIATFGGVAFRSLSQFADAVIELGPKIQEAFGAIMIGAMGVAEKMIPRIVALLGNLIIQVLTFLEAYGPQIVQIVVTLISYLITALADNFEPIALAVVNMYKKLLGVIAENVGPIIALVVNVIDKILIAISQKIPAILVLVIDAAIALIDGLVAALGGLIGKIVGAAVNLIITIIDALGEAIEDNAKLIREAVDRFMMHMLNAMLAFWGINSPSKKMAEIAGYLVDGLVKGIRDRVSDIIASGKKIITKFKAGITNNWHTISTYLSEKVTWISDKFKELPSIFIGIGKDVLDGFKEGLESIDLGSVMDDVFGWLPQWIKDKLGIASPSKVFAELGGYVAEGMAVGIGGNSDMVKSETEAMADKAMDGLEKSGLSGMMAKLYSALMSEFEDGIVIRPVMDLSGIYEGKEQIYSMMKDLNTVSIGGSNDMASKAYSGVRSTKQIKESTSKYNKQTEQPEQSTFNNTFNISGSDPKRIAQEVSKVLQNQVDRRHAKWAR